MLLRTCQPIAFEVDLIFASEHSPTVIVPKDQVASFLNFDYNL